MHATMTFVIAGTGATSTVAQYTVDSHELMTYRAIQ